MDDEMDDDQYHFEEGDRIDELETSYSYTSTTFLKVLCILTWVYTLISVFIFIYYFGNTTNAGIFINGIGDNAMTYMTFTYLLLPIICSGGSVLMFLRNKWGYVIYLFGQLPPIIYFAYEMYKMGGWSPFIVFPFIIYVAIPSGFAIMYATQLYVMRPMFNKESKFN